MAMVEQGARERLGARLRALRNQAGYTLTEFGEQIGVDASGLSRIENGERGIDTLVLRRGAEVLGVNLDAFFPASEERVVLARDGGVDEDRMTEIITWTKDLRRDIDLVARFGSDISA
jgi:transcriptional regulator with XRE-family HTH domain